MEKGHSATKKHNTFQSRTQKSNDFSHNITHNN